LFAARERGSVSARQKVQQHNERISELVAEENAALKERRSPRKSLGISELQNDVT
jgi:hypothetical protein